MFRYITTKTKIVTALTGLFFFILILSAPPENSGSYILIFLLYALIAYIKLYFISKTNKEKATFIFKAKEDYENKKNEKAYKKSSHLNYRWFEHRKRNSYLLINSNCPILIKANTKIYIINSYINISCCCSFSFSTILVCHSYFYSKII